MLTSTSDDVSLAADSGALLATEAVAVLAAAEARSRCDVAAGMITSSCKGWTVRPRDRVAAARNPLPSRRSTTPVTPARTVPAVGEQRESRYCEAIDNLSVDLWLCAASRAMSKAWTVASCAGATAASSAASRGVERSLGGGRPRRFSGRLRRQGDPGR
jgi:hypothetical protein